MDPPVACKPRILLACTMKSGSTYAADVLARYLGTEAGNADLSLYWPAEQNLSAEIFDQLGARSFVLQMHVRPYPPNLDLCALHGVRVALQWRNLGDVIASFDDHVRLFSEMQPVCYVHDRDAYLALPAQDRYAFLIRNALPWYLGFYLAWRRRRLPLRPYERMVADPHRHFRELLADAGESTDDARLASVLAEPPQGVRFNAGRAGRSAELFADETKRLLERTVLEYVPSADLEILLWELPWTVPALSARSDHDGAVVRLADEPHLYFVSRGVRYWIADLAWISSRTRLADEPVRVIDRAARDRLATGTMG